MSTRKKLTYQKNGCLSIVQKIPNVHNITTGTVKN